MTDDPRRARDAAVAQLEALRAPVAMADVAAVLGAPDRDVGSGIYVFEYALTHHAMIRVGSSDQRRVRYIRLVDGERERVLYQAPRKIT